MWSVWVGGEGFAVRFFFSSPHSLVIRFAQLTPILLTLCHIFCGLPPARPTGCALYQTLGRWPRGSPGRVGGGALSGDGLQGRQAGTWHSPWVRRAAAAASADPHPQLFTTTIKANHGQEHTRTASIAPLAPQLRMPPALSRLQAINPPPLSRVLCWRCLHVAVGDGWSVGRFRGYNSPQSNQSNFWARRTMVRGKTSSIGPRIAQTRNPSVPLPLRQRWGAK